MTDTSTETAQAIAGWLKEFGPESIEAGDLIEALLAERDEAVSIAEKAIDRCNENWSVNSKILAQSILRALKKENRDE